MISANELNYDIFKRCIVAQSADGDDYNTYYASGYVAIVVGSEAAIAAYDHCSCYGTWTAICQKHESCSPTDSQDITKNFDWTGTVKELIEMARRIADPYIPSRRAEPEDNDFRSLISMYGEVLKWWKREGSEERPPLSQIRDEVEAEKAEKEREAKEYAEQHRKESKAYIMAQAPIGMDREYYYNCVMYDRSRKKKNGSAV